MKVLLATNNQNKAREIRNIVAGKDIEIFTLSDLNLASDPEETGQTFAENATIKAEAALAEMKEKGFAGYAVAADDSGLCVDALEGGPGVYSARYAEVNGKPCTYKDNNKKLLKALKKIPMPERTAHFETVAVLINEDGTRTEAVGQLFGTIGKHERGHNGFGYDPIFIPEGTAITLAELSAEEKDEISHRGQAFRKLFA
ncbi:MAG: RdgB/HAM1 family non-canonical purine NTP pyrophosphatase [Coriobacteriia bacterium]|nr:RdgB/HAM1 family non-canonical purine NTP pyrophosphatase [Coriobacteriia bacterium]